MGEVVEGRRHAPDPLHRQGQHRLPRHHLPDPAEAARRLHLPQNVPANEFLNLEGQKLSTSRNWAVWLHEYIERWPDRQDELRYALATIMPEFKDSEFTWKDFQDKNNNELVAIIGNFVQRVFVLCHKYYGGKVPEPAPSSVGARRTGYACSGPSWREFPQRWPRK
jgi:methionyl-tRNA synthetase